MCNGASSRLKLSARLPSGFGAATTMFPVVDIQPPDGVACSLLVLYLQLSESSKRSEVTYGYQRLLFTWMSELSDIAGKMRYSVYLLAFQIPIAHQILTASPQLYKAVVFQFFL